MKLSALILAGLFVVISIEGMEKKGKAFSSGPFRASIKFNTPSANNQNGNITQTNEQASLLNNNNIPSSNGNIQQSDNCVEKTKSFCCMYCCCPCLFIRSCFCPHN